MKELSKRLATDLFAERWLLFVVGCRPVCHRLFVFVSAFTIGMSGNYMGLQ